MPGSYRPLRASDGAGAGMGGLERLAQMMAGDVRVDLRGGDPAVPEQLLHRAQIAAALDQVGRKRVTERVRPDPPRQAGRRGVPADEVEHALAGDPPAAGV